MREAKGCTGHRKSGGGGAPVFHSDSSGCLLSPEAYCVLLVSFHQVELTTRLPECPASTVVHFDKVSLTTKTLVFCAATAGAQVTQTFGTSIHECSRQCAKTGACVGFNHVEVPPLVCVQFHTPSNALLLTHGCTHYEVREFSTYCLRSGCTIHTKS